jgi:hypothetical protein
MIYEYGDYQVLTDTESVYEESYGQRYYEDGYPIDTVLCRDVMELETVESKVTKAGTFECARIRTTYFENEYYYGYSLTWITEEGTFVQLLSYDENGSISMEMSLVSETEPFNPLFIIFIVAIIIIGGGGLVIYFYKRRSSPSIHTYEPRISPSKSLTKRCRNCGVAINPSPVYQFCENCGTKVER